MLLLISVCFVFRDNNDERGWKIYGQSVFLLFMSRELLSFHHPLLALCMTATSA